MGATQSNSYFNRGQSPFTLAIASMMENQETRDEKQREYMAKMKERADNKLNEWSQPARANGHWKGLKNTAKYEFNRDKMPIGRDYDGVVNAASIKAERVA